MIMNSHLLLQHITNFHCKYECSKYKSILFHQIYLFIRTSRITEYENEVEVCKGKYKSLILEMIKQHMKKIHGTLHIMCG